MSVCHYRSQGFVCLSVISRACAENHADAVDRLLIAGLTFYESGRENQALIKACVTKSKGLSSDTQTLVLPRKITPISDSIGVQWTPQPSILLNGLIWRAQLLYHTSNLLGVSREPVFLYIFLYSYEGLADRQTQQNLFLIYCP